MKNWISRWYIVVLFLAPVAVWGAATGFTTLQAKTAAASAVNLSGVAAAEGTSLGFAKADHGHSISGTLPVGNGGTGLGTLTLNNVMLGNGTSTVQFVAPGTNGNVLTSNGTTWQSTAAPSGFTAGGDLSGTSTSQNVISVAHVAGGTLAEAYGGTGAGALTCASGQALTSNGTLYSCTSTITASSYSGSATPSGSAGGDLAGTYPSPTVAAVHETSGPTKLTFGTVADGEYLKRSGSTIVSAAVSAAVSRQTFSSSGSSITGTGQVYAAITASFNGTITLPAASTAGQWVTVADETGGPFCGSASSAGVNLITLIRAGSDTITMNAPMGTTGLTKLMLWAAGGVVALVSSGGGVWMVTARAGWGVDPKTISGIKGWYDARCGVTIATGVSQWNDLSGAGVNVVQATGANQPVYSTGANGLPMILTGQVGGPGAATNMGSSSTINLTSGALSVYAVDHHDWGDNSEPIATQYGMLWFGGYSAATGAGIIRTWTASNADQANHGYAFEGNGWNLSTTPKVTNYQTRTSGQYSILISARIGSTVSDMKINGAPVTTIKVSRKSAVPTYNTQNVYMMQGAQRDGMSLIMFFDASVSDANDVLLSDAINQTWRLY